MKTGFFIIAAFAVLVSATPEPEASPEADPHFSRTYYSPSYYYPSYSYGGHYWKRSADAEPQYGDYGHHHNHGHHHHGGYLG